MFACVLTGVSVIQRQAWLLSQPKAGSSPKAPVFMSKDQAYDQARKELYDQRHSEEVEVRVAREEALSTGAYFGANRLEVGMELENQTFEQWKEWAKQQVVLMEQARNAAYTGLGTQSSADEVDSPGEGQEDNDPLNTAADLLGGSVTNPRKGQEARGGAASRP